MRQRGHLAAACLASFPRGPDHSLGGDLSAEKVRAPGCVGGGLRPCRPRGSGGTCAPAGGAPGRRRERPGCSASRGRGPRGGPGPLPASSRPLASGACDTCGAPHCRPRSPPRRCIPARGSALGGADLRKGPSRKGRSGSVRSFLSPRSEAPGPAGESLDSPERVVGLSGNQLSLLPPRTQTKHINSAQWKMQKHSSSKFSVIVIWKNGSETWTFNHLKKTFNFIKRNLTLLIKTAQQDDSGLYLLEVTDDSGRVKNHQFQVSVFDHVGTLEIVEERKVLDGGRCQVSLSCSVSRGGNVSYVWYRGSKLIQTPSNLSKLEEQIDVNALDIYTCNVSNPVSWVNHTFTQSCRSVDKQTSRGEILTVYEDVNTVQNRSNQSSAPTSQGTNTLYALVQPSRKSESKKKNQSSSSSYTIYEEVGKRQLKAQNPARLSRRELENFCIYS
ncbi:natural killer cell receptor 2B4 isoform X5 [Callorhinus ursinus]|uniref:natural killer cell receptor 2B4 isoform X5 n=1 Tax=Callorhinus ursinus TaxID=34884 RepID=UPI003CD033E8